jgi:hypothetical protein
VAESPEPRESLIKREADLPAADPIASKSTSGWMMVSALLLTISIAWALYDEAFGQRPWKGMQREFVARYTRYLDSIKNDAGKSETEIKESPGVSTARRRRESRARAGSTGGRSDHRRRGIACQAKLNAITDTFKTARTSHRHQLQHRDFTGRRRRSYENRPKARGGKGNCRHPLTMTESQKRVSTTRTRSTLQSFGQKARLWRKAEMLKTRRAGEEKGRY